MNRSLLGLSLLLAVSLPAPAHAAIGDTAARLAGSEGVVYVVDAAGAVLVAHNADRAFVPASTLKVVTTLLAAETMGLDARFATEFWVDGGRLVVRGQGDPFLVSEELDLLVAALAPKLVGQTLAGVTVDDSWFSDHIKVPGVTATTEPYDALNSATAVNFNTINVLVQDGVVSSAETQTPITPLAVEVAKRQGIRSASRINIGKNVQDARRYAGELIAAKLRGAGVVIGESVTNGAAPASPPLHRHETSRTLGDVCQAMLLYSNNYIANQVFLAIGAHELGAPATLEKSVQVAQEFVAAHPELTGIAMVEGSGISYDNRGTAASFDAALRLFSPHRALLKVRAESPHKTGTLTIAKTLVGYAPTQTHGEVRYVIMLDGSGTQRRWDLLEAIKQEL